MPLARILLAPLLATGLLAPASAARSPDLEGTWTGALSTPAGELRLVFHLVRQEGELSATMDSPDQGARGIPVDRVELAGDSVRLWITALQAGFLGRMEDDSTLVGDWRQAGQSLPLTLRRVPAGEETTARRPQEPRPPFPYHVEEVAFDNPDAPGVRLAGTLTLPPGEGPHPAVLLVSGSGPQDRDESLTGHRPFLVLADHLTRQGIAVLRTDDRGVGRSTGDFAAADSRDFASDALAGVRWLADRPGIDSPAVGIVGHSEGALVAGLVAAEHRGPAFLVLLAGPGVPGDSLLVVQGAAIRTAAGLPEARIRRVAELQRELNRALVPTGEQAPDPAEVARLVRAMMAAESGGRTGAVPDAAIRAQVVQLTGPWFRFFLRHDPAETLRKVDVPVLALFGSLDRQVPPAVNAPPVREALRTGGAALSTVRVLPGLNHLFQTATTGNPAEYGRIEETMAPAALDAVTAWIRTVTGIDGNGGSDRGPGS